MLKRPWKEVGGVEEDEGFSFAKKIRRSFSRISQLFNFFAESGDLVKGNVKIQPLEFQLHLFPTELLFHLFDFSSAEILSKLAMTSIRFLSKVSAYLTTAQFSKRFSKEANALAFGNAADLDGLYQLFASYGRLLKTCSIFKSNEYLVDFVVKLYTKTQAAIKTNHGWAMLFSEAFRDCSQEEFYAFMKKFVQVGLLDATIQVLTSEKKMNCEELDVRRKIFAYFLEGCAPCSLELSFRLSALLRLLSPPELNHRLLLLLSAPVVKNTEGVSDFVDYFSPYNLPILEADMSKQILGEIPEMVEALMASRALDVAELRWSEMKVFNLLENLTTYPEPWVLPNFSAFLLSSPQLARLAIFSRAFYGSEDEAGYTLYCCIEMAIRLGRDPNTLLYLAAREVSSKCPLHVCFTVFRESMDSARERCSELFSQTEEVDRELIQEILEVNRQVTVLFQSMLYHIFA